MKSRHAPLISSCDRDAIANWHSLAGSPAVQRVIKSLCHQFCPPLPPEIERDCQQEASIRLWRIDAQLSDVAADQRMAYAIVCIRHHLVRYLRREQQRCAMCLSPEDTRLLHAIPLAEQPYFCLEPFRQPVDTLRDSLGDSALLDAFDALAPIDQLLLSYTFVTELSDREIAARLQLTTTTVKVRRHRSLRRIWNRLNP